MVSLGAMSAHRASVFTFESSVHSSHVLRRLDELRQRDTLCDVTVVVEGQSFRAHRSVLASCSEYFAHRISALTQHGAVVTLPQEVTVAGFEPLLQFAYTSKLLFGKENVLEIRNSASILGIRDLEDACFEFLLPKFFPSNTGSVPILRKTCCKKKCKRRLSKDDRGIISDDASDGKEAKPAADSPPQQEVAGHCNRAANSKMGSQNSAGSLTPVSEGTNDLFMQCPKYRRQLACGKGPCVSERSVNNPAAVIRDDFDLSCSSRSSCASSKSETEVELSGNSTSNPAGPSKGGSDDSWKSERPDEKNEADVAQNETNERQGKEREEGRNADVREDVGFSDRLSVKMVSSGPSAALGEVSPGLILHRCPLKTSVGSSAISGSVGHKSFVMDFTARDRKAGDSGSALSSDHKAEKPVEAEWKRAEREEREAEERKGGERGSMEARERDTTEKEVAEHMAQRLGCDLGSSQPCYPDSDAGSSSDSRSVRAQSSSLEWLNFHVNLGPTSNVCPFLQDLDQSKCLWKGAELSECEVASQSGVSSLNSGEDGDSETETEGDSESSARERARQVQLPFSVDWIVDLSRNDFQQLLKQQALTREQLEFVHDMRRRSKNRLAAQRCRKRKLDCIYNLQCEINKLKTEREKLMMEKSQLGQLKLKTCHSVSSLFQKVCNEANLQPEQLQVLSKYTSSDCPLASYLPHMDTPLSQPRQPPQPQALLSACSADPDEHMASEESSSSSSRDTPSGGGQHLL